MTRENRRSGTSVLKNILVYGLLAISSLVFFRVIVGVLSPPASAQEQESEYSYDWEEMSRDDIFRTLEAELPEFYLVERNIDPLPELASELDIENFWYTQLASKTNEFSLILADQEAFLSVLFDGLVALAPYQREFASPVSLNFIYCQVHLSGYNGLSFKWYNAGSIAGHMAKYYGVPIAPNMDYWDEYSYWGFDVMSSRRSPQMTFLFQMNEDFSCRLAAYGTDGEVYKITNEYLAEEPHSKMLRAVPQ